MSLRYLTAGESHGKALVGILEGMPANLSLDEAYLNLHLKRRKLGFGRGARQKIETDAVEILSGIRHGKTLGSPIALLIRNNDWKTWSDIMAVEAKGPECRPDEARRCVEVPRPGHADLVGGIKYGHSDMRNVLERASARETAARVALATVARRLLEECGIHIGSRVTQIGTIRDESVLEISTPHINEQVDASPVRCLAGEAEKAMIREIEKCRNQGNTVGGTFEVIVSGLPVGLGSHVHWDRRIEGILAQQLMSLNAIKAVEVGLGVASAAAYGSQAHDEIFIDHSSGSVRYETNRSGGIVGGMTTSQNLVLRATMKPLATLMRPLRSVRLRDSEPTLAHIERSDVCAVPAAAVIGESLAALALADVLLQKFGGDSMQELLPRIEEWNGHARAK